MADDKAIWDPRNLAHGEAFSLPRGDGDETDDYVLECWTELDDVVYVFAFEEDHDVDTDEPPFLFRYDIDEDGVPGLDDVEEEALEDLLFSYWEAWVKNIGAATGIYPIHRETRTRYHRRQVGNAHACAAELHARHADVRDVHRAHPVRRRRPQLQPRARLRILAGR